MNQHLDDDDGGARHRVLARLLAEVHDGLRHGYFEFRVTCEVIGGGRRRVVLHAGKTYQFVLPAESCTATKPPDDPQHAAAVDRDSPRTGVTHAP